MELNHQNNDINKAVETKNGDIGCFESSNKVDAKATKDGIVATVINNEGFSVTISSAVSTEDSAEVNAENIVTPGRVKYHAQGDNTTSTAVYKMDKNHHVSGVNVVLDDLSKQLSA